jgi:uncharacterized protein (TIGR02118 family)
MIKLTFCLRRLPHLSRADFQRYWGETHGPLVRRHATALRIARYVQVHALNDPINDALRASRGGLEAYDGVAEIWWASRGDLESTLSTAEAQDAARVLLEDERRFIDLERSALWIGEEKIVIPGS